MDVRKKIVENTAYNLLSGFVTYPMTIIAGVIISRTLDPQNYGIWSLCLVYGSISSRIATMGLIPGCNTYMMKALSTDGDDGRKLFSNIIVLEFVLVVFGSMLSAAIAGLFYNGEYLLSTLRIAVIYNVVISLNYIFNYIYQAKEVMSYRLSITILSLSANMVALIIWAKYFHGIRSLFGMSLAMYSVIFISQFIFIKHKFSIWSWKHVNIYYWIKIVKRSFFFAINSQALLLYLNFDVMMLSWLSSSAQIGYYTISYAYLTIAMALPSAIGWATFPALSRIQDGAPITSPDRHYYPLLKAYLSLGVFVSLFYFVFSDIFIPVLYGSAYKSSILPLKIISVAVLFSYLGLYFASFLTTGNRERGTAVALTVGLLINILLNLFLIPRYEATGAAMATAIAEILLCAMYASMFYSKVILFKWSYIKTILYGIILTVTLGFALGFYELPVAIKTAMFILGYAVIIKLTNIYPAEAINQVWNVLGRIRLRKNAYTPTIDAGRI